MSNSPTPNQDELEAILETYRQQYVNADLGTMNDDVQAIEADNAKYRAKAALRSYIDRTVAERLLAIIGEDEPASTVDQEEQWLIDARNGLRAELRTAAQQQKGTEK